MAIGVLGADAPDIDVPSTEEPSPEVHDASAHEEMPPPRKPAAPMKPSTVRQPNAPSALITKPSQVDASVKSSSGSSFPWWLVILLLVMSEGKKR